MRAYQLPKGGAGIDALAKIERPNPKPSYRQVLVKVAACSLNFRDLGIVRGTYRMPVRDNIVPLSDGAGEVVEVGAGVTRVKIGDKVAGCFFQRWPGGEAPPDAQASALGGSIDGMLAEYVVLEEEGVVRIPAYLSSEEGATLPCAALTAWHALVEHGKVIAGQTVLLQGTGGAAGARNGLAGCHHVIERRETCACQEPQRQQGHKLQEYAGLGEGRDGIHRWPRR
jgi:NADPH:quinone reductase-like Zn-dependent oxidoreductase